MSKETGYGREVRAWIPPLAIEAYSAEEVVLVGGHHLVVDYPPPTFIRAHAVAIRALVDQLARGRERGRLREAREETCPEPAAGVPEAAVDVEECVRALRKVAQRVMWKGIGRASSRKPFTPRPCPRGASCTSRVTRCAARLRRRAAARAGWAAAEARLQKNAKLWACGQAYKRKGWGRCLSVCLSELR